MTLFSRFILLTIPLLFPISSIASETTLQHIDLTQHSVGFIALFVFAIAYILVIMEEQLHLKKSKPVLLAAGIIWVMIAAAYQSHGFKEATSVAIRHNFLEYSELFFFLLVAMTYINAMLERGVFDSLRGWLVGKGYSYRMLFWITGILAFFISPIADNLTTALIMCAVVMSVGSDNPRFISISCINIVVAANAGGAFSPFGDITTLMVWQKGIIEFSVFFKLFIPAVINFVIPAAIMHSFISTDKPNGISDKDQASIKRGGWVGHRCFIFTDYFHSNQFS